MRETELLLVFLNHPLSPFRLRRAENDQDDERGDIFFRVREEVEGLGMGDFLVVVVFLEAESFSIKEGKKCKPVHSIFSLLFAYFFDVFSPLFTGENRRRVSR